MECEICIEKYNKTTRLKVQCPYCEYSACRKCCETWLLNETNPRCLNTACGKEWTRQYVTKTFTKTFVSKDYMKHRESILFDQERALLPATQPLVENILKCEKIDKEIRRIEDEELRAVYARIHALRNERATVSRITTTATERSTFVKACPDSECRGFLSSQWKCGICEKWACSDCHEIKGLSRDCEHTCNPDNVATAALLANDTKSCPSCGTGIHKLEGCDQMFCTMCHTGFSWRTGRIETNIHNPHYFEWLRRTGGEVPRNPNDIQCGREITNTFTRNMTSEMRIKNIDTELINRVMRICESIIHFRYVELNRYAVDHVLNNQDLRIQYLRNLITEEDFKTQIQRIDKKHQKNREIHNVLTVLYNTATDIIYRFHDSINDIQRARDILNEMDTILSYVNECLLDISKTYNSKRIRIDGTMRER
jgi:mRNA-degrading endonuclease YafQ of YafQ-DinJ toxin-antitoxin module